MTLDDVRRLSGGGPSAAYRVVLADCDGYRAGKSYCSEMYKALCIRLPRETCGGRESGQRHTEAD